MIAQNCAPTRLMFSLGKTVATPEALRTLDACGEHAARLLVRHATGDWGGLCDDDKRLNDEAVAHEGDYERQQRVLSAYQLTNGEKLYVITEWDRSTTTILLASEY